MDERALPTINLDMCTGCGLCVDQCPTRAVEMGGAGRPVIVRPKDCAYCGLCEEMCPEVSTFGTGDLLNMAVQDKLMSRSEANSIQATIRRGRKL